MTTRRYWCEAALVEGEVVEQVAIVVTDGRFRSVDPASAGSEGATTLKGLTLPGFANAHSHAFHRALRSRTQADRGSFWTWREIMYRAAERLTPDNYHRLARATFSEMAMAGISSVGEFHYVHHQSDGTPYDDANEMGLALVSAATDAGIRLSLLDTIYLHGGISNGTYVDPHAAQVRYSDRSVDEWLRRVDALPKSGRHVVGAAIHSVRAVDSDSMATVAAWAEENGSPLHAHVSEQRAENDACLAMYGLTPIQLLDQVGALGPNFCAIHATHLTEEDRQLLGESGSAVCMCPTTERDLGDGVGPTTELAALGVELSLGSDSHAVIDMFEEARAVELDERLRSEQRGFHSAAELMEAATVQGHRHIGWTDAGAIAVGQRADLVTISWDSVRLSGAPKDTTAAVFAATTSDVDHVVVDGEVVVVDGAHVSIDVVNELEQSITELLQQ